MKVWEVNFHISFLRSLNNNGLYPIMEECSLVVGLLPCSAARNSTAQFPERPAPSGHKLDGETGWGLAGGEGRGREGEGTCVGGGEEPL